MALFHNHNGMPFKTRALHLKKINTNINSTSLEKTVSKVLFTCAILGAAFLKPNRKWGVYCMLITDATDASASRGIWESGRGISSCSTRPAVLKGRAANGVAVVTARGRLTYTHRELSVGIALPDLASLPPLSQDLQSNTILTSSACIKHGEIYLKLAKTNKHTDSLSF